MGQDPNTIRQEIEHTRSEMSETVEALGYKADVKSRARNKIVQRKNRLKEMITGPVTGATHQVGDTMSNVQGSVSGAVSGAGHTISEHTPSKQDIKQGTRQAVGVAQDNPIGMGIGAVALGFIAGMLAPRTRIEDERLGEASDQFRQTVRETGQEALERGQQVAQEAVSTAKDSAQEVVQQTKDTVKEQGQQQAQEMKSEHGMGGDESQGQSQEGQGGQGAASSFGESSTSQRSSERAGVT
jgi:gas vesicle protein